MTTTDVDDNDIEPVAVSRSATARHRSMATPVAHVAVAPPPTGPDAIEVPPIDIDAITQTSIAVAPLPALEPIVIAAIPLAPVDADAFDNQEKP